MLGHIHSEESFGALDGPGIRYVVFLQGCMLRCKYCHNPDSWDMRCGKTIDSDELLGRILECRSFITGVTLSGGEPLLQPDFCAEIISRCKKNGLHTAVDTSGAVPLKKCSAVIDLADLVLLDIKALDDELCRELTGHSNEHELKLLSYCESTDKPVWIRHVLLPGITLRDERLRELALFLKGFRCIEKIELLPFHKLGEYKWQQLGLDYTLSALQPPTEDELNAAEALFSS